MLLAQWTTPGVGAYPPAANYDLLPAGVAGRLDFVNMSDAEGLTFDPLTNDLLISTYGATDINGNFVDHVDLVRGFAAPTPEPASLVLLGTAMLGVGIAYRRKRRQ